MVNSEQPDSTSAVNSNSADGEIHNLRSRRIAEGLLDIGAVELNPSDPFTWSSGLVAPIYCDNRLTISHPPVRRAIRDGFLEVVPRSLLEAATIAGTATAGIPHAAWLSLSWLDSQL